MYLFKSQSNIYVSVKEQVKRFFVLKLIESKRQAHIMTIEFRN